MELTKLGTRALSSFSVWITALVWTLCYADGAGFGAMAYRNVCSNRAGSYEFPDSHCPLVRQALFPPHVSPIVFGGNIFGLWFNGMYDSGLMVGFFLVVILLLCASQMRRFVADMVFSWPVILLGMPLAWGSGYLYEIHQTLSTGIAQVPRFPFF